MFKKKQLLNNSSNVRNQGKSSLAKLIKQLSVLNKESEYKPVFEGYDYNGFYEKKVREKIRMWKCGRCLNDYFEMSKKSESYNQLSKKLKHCASTLKRWHETYLKCPNFDAYVKVAEQECKQWREAYFARLMFNQRR